MTTPTKPAENPIPKRKRGRPRNEKTPKPKRPRGRPPGPPPETVNVLFEFISTLDDVRYGGRMSQKRALRAAAARVKIALPVPAKAPSAPVGFKTLEQCILAANKIQDSIPTRSLTPDESRRIVDSATRFLKAEKARSRHESVIPRGGMNCAPDAERSCPNSLSSDAQTLKKPRTQENGAGSRF